MSNTRADTATQRAELRRRIDAIESAYELLLGYAAQGLPSDVGSTSGASLRSSLTAFSNALEGLADRYRALVVAERPHAQDAYRDFLDVLARDAAVTRAALQMVLAQPAISSMLADNFNASVHVRALLTDVFLVDEALKDTAGPSKTGQH